MGYLDYSGLSHFLDKIKAMVFTGATSSANGANGLVPGATSANRAKYLKADATWDSPALSELGLSVVNGAINITYQKEVEDE